MLAARRTLIASLLTLALVAVASAGAAMAANGDCTELQRRLGQCADAAVIDGGVELGASTELPGSGVDSTDESAAPIVSFEPVAETVDTVGESWCDLQRLPCVPWTPPAAAPAEASATGPVTISDIATFRPQPASAAMQPNQWMIVGLATNFYGTASAHVVDGTLFGGTAQVRFTPIAHNWNYGDGNTATHDTAGTTWAKYKIAEFDPTPTSHSYDEPGNYTITMTVTYAAEYRVAGIGWRNVVGTLTIAAPPLSATAGHATTVLVDQDCNANPTGIGC